ncbi:LuxR family transcriptional regulator [Oscillatoriales cyanobacterium LEGE 11467]|uniref:LuxR family transcriptional regulator n=1 Tax=Zarconia navalis LEGE 11467 TaxID=1828826 RepID=A0A928VXH7_9CYAN|nr:NB-ARC domain-containing protein [Zarconia navalis]MBE9039958.1 LuxR family transcriptional regulator [Zarconia navalis LEGE 11467]
MKEKNCNETFDRLPRRRKDVLELFLQGKTDAEIEKLLYITQATVRKHIGNICSDFGLSEEFSYDRSSKRPALMALFAKYKPELMQGNSAVTADSTVSSSSVDWGEAPEVEEFYDRTEELATLKQWLLEKQCRLVVVWGMAGIGKTALAVMLADEIQSQFDCFIWRSLQYAPALPDLLADIIQFLSPTPNLELPDSVSDRTSKLMGLLQNHRCLIVLDNVETVLPEGHRDDGEYGDFLRRVGRERHRSCVLLNSREKPGAVTLVERETRRVKSLQLEGLKEAAREIFREEGLTDEADWNELINHYRGNPHILRLVAWHVKELCGGRVSKFLDLGTTLLNDELTTLLSQQFDRLSPLEKQIVAVLMQTNGAVSLERVRDRIQPPSSSELMQALTVLKDRSLVEQVPTGDDVQFSLPPLIRRFASQHCPLTE